MSTRKKLSREEINLIKDLVKKETEDINRKIDNLNISSMKYFLYREYHLKLKKLNKKLNKI